MWIDYRYYCQLEYFMDTGIVISGEELSKYIDHREDKVDKGVIKIRKRSGEADSKKFLWFLM